MQDIDGCVGDDVLDDLILGVGVNLLEFLDGVVIEIVLDIIKKERPTTLPLQLTVLMGLPFSTFFSRPFKI